MDCGAIRSSMASFLQSETEVISNSTYCILSLPIRALDGANAEVFIEEFGKESFIVHDGGKTFGRLAASGLVVSPIKEASLASLARRMGIGFEKRAFTAIAKQGALVEVAMSVAQCASMALYELIRHSAFGEDERIRVRASHEVSNWAAIRGYAIHDGYKALGHVRQYSLDFVIEASPPIAVDVLVPSGGTWVAVDRYAAQVLDLRPTRFGKWKRIAALGHPQMWTEKARKSIGTLCDGHIAEIPDPTDSGEMFQNHALAEVLDSLVAA